MITYVRWGKFITSTTVHVPHLWMDLLHMGNNKLIMAKTKDNSMPFSTTDGHKVVCIHKMNTLRNIISPMLLLYINI